VSASPEELTLDTIRTRTSFVSLTEAFSLAWLILLYNNSEAKKYIYLPKWLIISILTASLLLSFSRTLIISFLISILAMRNFFSFRLSTVIVSGVKILILVLLLILSLVIINRTTEKESILHSFTDKYLNSVKENTFRGEYSSMADYNRNWRGYETHLTKKEIKKAGLFEKIFGYGFGKTVYIGNKGFLGEGLENIPKFHNGFIEIILKTGYIGLIMYLIFFFYLFRIAERTTQNTEFEKLFKAIIVSAFLSTLVMTGIYNKSALDSSCLLLGYFSGLMLHKYREIEL
jgi:uncharacterized membrane protein YhdT